ncbi:MULTISPECIES: NifU family protein [Salegentibacter]|jgi:Fe-S cluster biogenesis protein NfuA|uniref:Fe-S cluster biogenesis protein NfuA, 4Fe-4S-binding domain n=1 Tax=Salegentibacter agarivorans TaxID=345907 RepID=A0A1I2MQQ1_9FLAO|nr:MULTISPECIES: NifU family protein [Salegentibacter]APS38434.1 nitrogen fixation protein NifU [Salegentibacter sp. T436]SFF93782.1 Fe-S cluster biogenesis protein NfuA, 4Fe-4S-binding domain [Salegentibacter agarivorans]
MSNFTINIQATNKPGIIKFETNKFLTRHENHEFKNIDEASKSPIAQQLFYLPFVKTVYIAQNFIAIEKYDIVEWDDVQEEVASQIEEFLNKGGVVVKEDTKDAKNVPVTVYAESTPNPGVMKFVANKKLVLKTAEFKNIDEAKDAPLAQQLFHFPFVKAVFIDSNYVSIHKYDVAQWEEITLELREFITNYLQDGKEVLKAEASVPQQTEAASHPANPEVSQEIKDLDDTSKQVIAILDEYIKPAVASDGGNILFDSYNADNKTVKVILQGACSGCPSSTMTLKSGIETMLRDMLRGKVDYVEAVNG